MAVTCPGDAQAPTGHSGRRWAPVGALALAFIALVTGVLALPGGKEVGDSTTNITITETLPVDRPVIQPFVASDDRLAAVFLMFDTFGDTAECDLRITLVERDGAPGVGPEIDSRAWSCSDLPDSGRFEMLDFEPIEDSEGVLYDVLIERLDRGLDQAAELWVGPIKGDALPVRVDGSALPDTSAAVRGEYNPQSHRWAHLATTLERLAAYGPEWGGPLAFGVLIAMMGGLLALTPLARRGTRNLVILVAVLAVVRGLVWSAAVPALEAMDEPAHFAYVQFLAEEREFPGHVDNADVFSDRLEGTIAELNVEATVPGDRPAFTPGAEEEVRDRLGDLSPRGGGGGPGTMYAPFYYLPAVPLYYAAGDDILDQIVLARLWTVLLGALAAVLLVFIGRLLFPHSEVARVAFVVAGVMQPMVAHQFAIVNNDAWVVTAGFAALLVALELARRRRAPWLALAAGGISGAALLGKPFGVAVVVPLAVGWLVGKLRTRERSWQALVGEPLLVLGGFALTYGLWAATAARLELTTSAVPEQIATGQTLGGFLHAQFGNNLDAARAIWGHQLWGAFGWVRIPLPPPVPQFFFVLTAAVVAGLAVWAVLAARDLRRGRDLPASTERPDPRYEPLPLDTRLVVVAAMIFGCIGTLYVAGWLYYMATGANDLLQGRYALLAIPAFIAAPALLVERFWPTKVGPAVVPVVAAVGLVTAHLLGLLVVLEAFYG